METAEQLALEQYSDMLSALKNVVGVGIAHGLIGQSVAVYVSKKMPLDKLSDEDVVPKFLEVVIGSQKIQVPTTVHEQGIVEHE